MDKASEHKEGLQIFKGLVFGLLNIVAIIMVWNDPNYRWFNVISLLAWVLYVMLAFFVAGETQDEQRLKELDEFRRLQERSKNADQKENNEEE